MAKAKNGNGKAQSLDFERRVCKLGASMNGRVELHGEEELVPADDLAVDGFLLNKHELCELFGDAHVHDAWFDTKGNFKTPTDWVKRVKAFMFQDKFENCGVSFFLGTADDAVALDGVRIAKIRLLPKPGGFTEMSFQVQTTTEDDDAIARIRRFRGKEIDAYLALGNIKGEGKPAEKAKRNQPELPMDHRAEEEGEESRAH